MASDRGTRFSVGPHLTHTADFFGQPFTLTVEGDLPSEPLRLAHLK